MEAKSWNPDYFKIYLKSLSRGTRYALPTSDYAPAIRLDGNLHGLLNGFGMATEEDGIERWGFIGFNEGNHSLIASDFVKGKRNHVPAEVIMNETNRARRKGIDRLVMDIHSHPAEFNAKYLGPLGRAIISHMAQFSVADLYCMLTQERFLPVMGLVEGESNLLAFRTQESENIPVARNLFPKDKFEQYWYNKFGIYFIEGERPYSFRDLVDAILSIPGELSNIFNPLNINLAIAGRHKLVLYKGNKNEDLARIYPPLVAA